MRSFPGILRGRGGGVPSHFPISAQCLPKWPRALKPLDPAQLGPWLSSMENGLW